MKCGAYANAYADAFDEALEELLARDDTDAIYPQRANVPKISIECV